MLKFFWESIKTGLSMWCGWVTFIAGIGGIAVFIINKIFPKINFLGLISKFSLIIFAASLILGIVIGTYKTYSAKDTKLNEANKTISELQKKLDEERPKGFAIPDQLIGEHLEGLDIRIVDLAREDLIIKNRTFVNCRIYGPAVLLPKGCFIIHCGFEGPSSKSLENKINTFFIPAPKTDILQGVISMEYVTFRDCEFYKIAFLGSDQFKKQLLNGMAQGNEKAVK